MPFTTQTPVSGKHIIGLIQALDAATGSSALLPMFQTDASHTFGGDLADEQTKNGRILDYATDQEDADITFFMAQDDEAEKLLKDSKKNHKKLKYWEVNVNTNANGKHDATFAYIVLDDLSFSYPQDGFVEVKAKIQIIGQSQDGEIDLDPEIVEAAQYAFESPGETGTAAVTSVTTDSASVSIAVGATHQIVPTVAPADADQSVTYQSDNTSVATVNASGLITGVTAGSANITVTSVSDPTKKSTVAVTVTGA